MATNGDYEVAVDTCARAPPVRGTCGIAVVLDQCRTDRKRRVPRERSGSCRT
jgi:hypothetical protein